MDANFKVDETLEHDSYFVAKLKLSQIRLINNSDYNWLILVPQKNNTVEITDLSLDEYSLLYSEIRFTAEILQKLYNPDKLNIAIIGNKVKQLHVHVIARFKDDKLFPKPVWGCDFTPYSSSESESIIIQINDAVKSHQI